MAFAPSSLILANYYSPLSKALAASVKYRVCRIYCKRYKMKTDKAVTLFSFARLSTIFFLMGIIFSILNMVLDSGSGWAAGYKTLRLSIIMFFGFTVSGLIAGIYARIKNESSSLGLWLNGIILFICLILVSIAAAD